MQPVACVVMAKCSCLGQLTFMMGELEIHAAAMNVKGIAQVAHAHRHTFRVPSRKSFLAQTVSPTH